MTGTDQGAGDVLAARDELLVRAAAIVRRLEVVLAELDALKTTRADGAGHRKET